MNMAKREAIKKKPIAIATRKSGTTEKSFQASSRAVLNNTECAKLYGVNYLDPKLLVTEKGLMTNLELCEPMATSIKRMASYRFNLIRVPFYWEAFDLNSTAVLDELEAIMMAATNISDINVKIIIDFHHYGVSSYIYDDVWHGGIPSSWLSAYTRGGDKASEDLFWRNFWTNSITKNGKPIWKAIAEDVFQPIYNRCDKRYTSGKISTVLYGYELINEPRVYTSTHYSNLGRYHSYVTDKLRSFGTKKKILFNRAYLDTDPGITDMTNSPKIAPTNRTGTVFAPHRYSAVYTDIFAKYITLANNWGNLPIIMGEWANASKTDKNNYMLELKNNNIGWTYWAWQPQQSTLDSQELLDTGNNPTTHLNELSSLLNTHYP